MKPFMILERARIPEFLAAVTTHKLGLLVHPHVQPQLSLGAEFRVAQLAVDLLLAMKRPHVPPHGVESEQYLAAFRTRELIHDAFVNFPDMRLQRAFNVELPVALFAFMDQSDPALLLDALFPFSVTPFVDVDR